MRIAVIGAGIAGVGSAWLLSPDHTVDVYAADPWLGGHARTIDVTAGGLTFPVDTGFQVFNERTYPNLIRFFERLGTPWMDTDMSFSVSVAAEGVEWSGTNLDTVFAQRSNALKPRFLAMLADVVRFSHDADRLLADPALETMSLGELLARERYSAGFTDWYLIPMGAAIWSTPPGLMLDYPAATFLRFCDNHGLLHITDKPIWRSVTGGSRLYVEAALATLSGEAFAGTPVERVERSATGVRVHAAGAVRDYDAAVIATHPPEALAMLGAGATPAERSVLSAIAYQPNEALVSMDRGFLPRTQRAWASWNWHTERGEMNKDAIELTYLINRLQRLPEGAPVVVETLNARHQPSDEDLLARLSFDHPLFDADAIAAQKRLGDIQGVDRLWFAGAWARYGFHEDGLLSAVRVAEALGSALPWGAELDPTRTKVLRDGAAGVRP